VLPSACAGDLAKVATAAETPGIGLEGSSQSLSAWQGF